MTRITLSRRPVARIAQRAVRRQYGRKIDPVGVYGHVPRLLLGWGALEKATERSRRVEPRLKVLAELRAGTLVNCEFCIDIGSKIAHDAGISEAQLLALPRYRESDEFDELEKLVLDYATAMTRTPADVSEELFTELREHFDDAEMVELTNVIALENMRGRFNSAFDMTPGGFAEAEGIVCALPEPAERAAA
jgi:alkylhydroperoxidase family enzyme